MSSHHRLHVPAKRTQGCQQRTKHEPVGVLEEAQPPHALLRPRCSQAAGMLRKHCMREKAH